MKKEIVCSVSLLFLFDFLAQLTNVRCEDEAFCKMSYYGFPGYCISLKTHIKYCSKLHSWLINGDSEWVKLKDTVCSTDLEPDGVKVCCPVGWYDESSRVKEVSHYSSHPNFKLLPHDSICGYISVGGRIIGGQKSNPGDFPWMARIGLKKRNGELEEFFGCSGTIINNRYILTAAHCVPNVMEENQKIFVRLADTDESVNPESITIDGFVVSTSPYLDFDVEEIKVHPGYKQGNPGSQHDIALLRVKSDINISSSFTQPICLPFVNEYSLEAHLNEAKIVNGNATVCGWGKTNSSDTGGSSVLQSVEVPVVQNVVCRIVYNKDASVTPNQICAGGLKGMSSCSGDSGGPLTKIAKRDDRAAKIQSVRHYQIGIVSFGKTKCGKENEPVVYTRVKSYLKWILDSIRE